MLSADLDFDLDKEQPLFLLTAVCRPAEPRSSDHPSFELPHRQLSKELQGHPPSLPNLSWSHLTPSGPNASPGDPARLRTMSVTLHQWQNLNPHAARRRARVLHDPKSLG